jgi:hypothetical protein
MSSTLLPPHANSFVIGPAVIKHTHIYREVTPGCLFFCQVTGGCQSSSVEDQPQCPGQSTQGLWHSSNPNAHSLSHSPSTPPPSLTQFPYPPRSLVRDWQTSPHGPRLVVSRSTCPPLSSHPHANSFVIGPAVIKHTPQNVYSSE